MKRQLFFALMICASAFCVGQKSEFWKGELETGVMNVPITLELSLGNDTTALLGSPSQTKELFPASKVRLRNDSLLVSVTLGMSKVVFRGAYNKTCDTICGTFTQQGQSLPLCLSKGEKSLGPNRPQTPRNIDYVSEDVSFKVKDVDYTFHGTLTYPKQGSNFPAVVLVSGSGLQNRDEEIFLHKPFAVIADFLTRRGIAVLRYDDRGFGTEDAALAEGTTLDFAEDAQAAFELLYSHPKIDRNKIGIAGHSEGGAIAPLVASKDKRVAFVIMLAGPGVKGEDVLIEQNRVILSQSGFSDEQIEAQISGIRKREPKEAFGGKWMQCFLDLDPKDYLTKVSVPVLALNGEKDVQVLASQNLPAIEAALKQGKNKHFKVAALPNLNHLFQHCETGLPNEYYTIEETFSEEALQMIADFIEEYVL